MDSGKGSRGFSFIHPLFSNAAIPLIMLVILFLLLYLVSNASNSHRFEHISSVVPLARCNSKIGLHVLLRPNLDSFSCLTDPGDSEILSTRFNTQSSLLM